MLNSPIDEIKNRLNIVEVIQSYIKLQKAGANFKALCPFHSEKIPSLFVSSARQIWHCFGCQKGGSIFNFVMEIEGVEFGDALRILAQKAGVELKRQDPKIRTERQKLYEICDLSCRFFEKQLEENKTGKLVKQYLLQRELKEDSLKKWRLGYAPDSWQGLSDFLIDKGYQKEEVVRAGLAIKKENRDGNLRDTYDRFRGRIMFPIFDLNSQVIGFGGRILEGKEAQDEAKYMNTPSTLLYDKSQVLYGLDKARVEIRKKNFCILVEGYIDVILSHQVGFENTVATSGTALTSSQLQILKRYSENLLTAFDMDVAGNMATRRGIDLAQARGFAIKVITMQEDSDPADIISKDQKVWERLVSEAKSILDFYFETAFVKFDKKSPEGKKEISKILLPIIKIVPNKIEQSHWISKLAKNLEVKEEVISEELKKTSSQGYPEILETRESLKESKKKSRQEMLEEKILTLALKSPLTLRFIEENQLELFTKQTKEILVSLKENPDFDFERNISSESLELLSYIFLKADFETEEIDAEREIQICLQEIQGLCIKTKLDEISQEIKKAEEEENLEKVNLLMREFNQLSQKLTEV